MLNNNDGIIEQKQKIDGNIATKYETIEMRLINLGTSVTFCVYLCVGEQKILQFLLYSFNNENVALCVPRSNITVAIDVASGHVKSSCHVTASISQREFLK